MNSLLVSQESIGTKRKRRVKDGKWLCARGHNKNIVGATSEGYCLVCRRERDRRRRRAAKKVGYVRFLVEFEKPICDRRHDKRIVGVTPDRRCYACFKEKSIKRQKAKRRANPNFAGDSALIPNLAEVRMALGLSQAQLAQLSGYHEQTIHKIETGLKKASRRGQRRIVAAIAAIQKKRRELYVTQ